MALTDAAVRNSKSQAKPYTLEVKCNRVSLGQYPNICLYRVLV